MLQSSLTLLHQILNRVPASLAFVTWLFPAPKEPLEKFKAAAHSSVRRTPLAYDLSAFEAAVGASNLAAPRSEAGAPTTVQKEPRTEREGAEDQRNRAAIVQKCESSGTGWVRRARPPSSSERGTAKSTWNLLRLACAGTGMALEG